MEEIAEIAEEAAKAVDESFGECEDDVQSSFQRDFVQPARELLATVVASAARAARDAHDRVLACDAAASTLQNCTGHFERHHQTLCEHVSALKQACVDCAAKCTAAEHPNNDGEEGGALVTLRELRRAAIASAHERQQLALSQERRAFGERLQQATDQAKLNTQLIHQSSDAHKASDAAADALRQEACAQSQNAQAVSPQYTQKPTCVLFAVIFALKKRRPFAVSRVQ